MVNGVQVNGKDTPNKKAKTPGNESKLDGVITPKNKESKTPVKDKESTQTPSVKTIPDFTVGFVWHCLLVDHSLG